ncbi:hypothetical protein G4B88_004998 [Cannabis sativa]|uniref:Reverse transcriptase zinc-binding domain-containing protein n=1 Tax=Cannabis sativa TaxID=3483 RepID=A0A7J6FAP2_CANSA|nr:hypothetical protein G4B88_004998 [Cannabis sativa]
MFELERKLNLLAEYSNEDIKQAALDIPGNKSLCRDGFGKGQRIKTRDRLLKQGLIDMETCLFYNSTVEIVDHLLFGCVFAAECLDHVKNWF